MTEYICIPQSTSRKLQSQTFRSSKIETCGFYIIFKVLDRVHHMTYISSSCVSQKTTSAYFMTQFSAT